MMSCKPINYIFNCLETSPREIKSETLVSLLRALDAKHVSGWYHPAMRLQAEVHSLQGSNTTLRDQLRIARYNNYNLYQFISQKNILGKIWIIIKKELCI